MSAEMLTITRRGAGLIAGAKNSRSFQSLIRGGKGKESGFAGAGRVGGETRSASLSLRTATATQER